MFNTEFFDRAHIMKPLIIINVLLVPYPRAIGYMPGARFAGDEIVGNLRAAATRAARTARADARRYDIPKSNPIFKSAAFERVGRGPFGNGYSRLPVVIGGD